MTEIAEKLLNVKQLLAEACRSAGREPADVRLVAVSKTRPADDIRAAYAAGQTDFGENYVQEALGKIRALDDLPLCWHFIGPIQSNKTQVIAEHFAWVHSVERLKIAERLSRQRPADRPPLEICLQVNIDRSPSKSGCAPEETAALARAVAALPGLRLRGLMAVPDPGGGETPHRALADLLGAINTETGLRLDTLSMGMTDDMPEAIAAGATCVRIGTAIFGARGTED